MIEAGPLRTLKWHANNWDFQTLVSSVKVEKAKPLKIERFVLFYLVQVKKCGL